VVRLRRAEPPFEKVTSVSSDPTIQFSSDITVTPVNVAASDALVLAAARVSTLGDQAAATEGVLGDRDTGLINYLMRARHGSPFEHNVFTFVVRAPIFVWREHMRHRIASYNEESARYRVLDPVFYVPSTSRPLAQVGKPGHYEYVPGTPEQHQVLDESYKHSCSVAYTEYQKMLDQGVAKEIARGVLPTTIFSSAFVTMNARALMNFLSLRTKDEASAYPSFPQHEIEVVARQYEDVFATHMPVTHAAFVAHGRVQP
jgi:thymidylate synthase (FAD)